MNNLKVSRSEAMKLAHKLKSDTLPFGKAITKAWKVLKVKKAMQQQKVQFSFYKMAAKKSLVTGLVITDRTGTTNLNLIPKEFHPKKKAEGAKTRKQNPMQVKYFDFMRMGWRSFNAGRYCAAIL